MFGSKNKFFCKNPSELQANRDLVETLLRIKGYSDTQLNIYLEAYDFFCKNPLIYDGATIVKDLVDIPGLDLDSMLHDYHYYVFGSASSLIYKFKTDWIYTKGMERKGKGSYSCYSRFIGLSTLGLLFTIYVLFKRGRFNKNNKETLDLHYRILIQRHL